MASTSTINSWIEELAHSLLPSSPSKIKHQPRKAVQTFRKQVRHHNFARTNQFDVSNRLDGLEEKFQVLNREDFSDALYARRIELRQHEERWVPDALDLILRLSVDPLQNDSTKFSNANVSTEAPVLLRWSDVEANDPFDRDDPIWTVPNFNGLSSDEDEVEVSTATTSPASVKLKGTVGQNEPQFTHVLQHLDLNQAAFKLRSLKAGVDGKSRLSTDIQLIRQILLMAQGYLTDLFATQNGHIQLAKNLEPQNFSKESIQSLLLEIEPLRFNVISVKTWIQNARSEYWLQIMKHHMEKIMHQYVSAISALEESFLHPKSLQVASYLDIVVRLENIGKPLQPLAALVQRFENADSITCLDNLYDAVCEHYFTGDTIAVKIILPIFTEALSAYLRPIHAWAQQGILISTPEPFFVYSTGNQNLASSLWNGEFELDVKGSNRPPKFLHGVARQIFACGKTATFVNRINDGRDISDVDQPNQESGSLLKNLELVFSESALPLPMALLEVLETHFTSLLVSKTLILRQLLEAKCGMTRTLDAFEYIHLRKGGALLDVVEGKIFTRIDKCVDNWNDRFLIADMLEDIYMAVDCIDLDSITVQSIHTSSRSMENRRRSVRILEALAIDYNVPWPVANIIPKSSLIAYRRISLHLFQIRRAKYVLERTAHAHVNSNPISVDPRDQTLAQATTFMLLQFTNTLYDHFTTGITLPMTSKMRQDLRDAATVDAMIAVHESYMTNLEFACLTSKQLKMLRETLTGLLDMCIRFSDLVSTPQDVATGRRRESADVEAGSFVSAQSRRRRDGASSVRDEGSDEEDVDDGDGYSSFIVLGDDTSVVQEIKKLLVQFRRQLDFFVAGLRGVGRGGGIVEEFEVLAERLEWKGRMRM